MPFSFSILTICTLEKLKYAETVIEQVHIKTFRGDLNWKCNTGSAKSRLCELFAAGQTLDRVNEIFRYVLLDPREKEFEAAMKTCVVKSCKKALASITTHIFETVWAVGASVAAAMAISTSSQVSSSFSLTSLKLYRTRSAPLHRVRPRRCGGHRARWCGRINGRPSAERSPACHPFAGR